MKEDAWFKHKNLVIQKFPSNINICPIYNLNKYIKDSHKLCNSLIRPRPDNFWIDVNGKPL